jgi:protein transport protein SEC24
MQLNIEEQLTDLVTVSFQAAVLYTSSKSERRIRIHTFCLPVTRSVNEIVNGADQEAIVGLVSKMAADRTSMNSLKEARDALVNVALDYLQAYSNHVTSQKSNSIVSPYSLRLIPLFVLALMKNVNFRSFIALLMLNLIFNATFLVKNAFKYNAKIDDRVYAMNLCKTMPLKYLMLTIYPNLYALHNFDDTKVSLGV